MRMVESSMIPGMSPPYAATELAKTRRGQAPRARIASISRSEPWKLTCIPRSKFCSASPLTTAARWNTTPVSGSTSASAAPGSLKSPMRYSTRGSAGGAVSLPPMSLTTTRSISCSAPSGPASAPRSSRAPTRRRPRNPWPPVTSTFMRGPSPRACDPGRSIAPISRLTDANLLAAAGRAPSSRFETQCRLLLQRLSSPCEPLPRHPDARSCRTSVRHCGWRAERRGPAPRRPRTG